MAETSKIEWTDATVNFWWGCTKVGPGCDNCYAEMLDKRYGGTHWGHGAPRRKIKSAVSLIHKLDNDYAWWAADFYADHLHEHCGRRRRVFIQSMSDLFDLEVETEWFAEAWQHIVGCRWLDIQIVTKRVSAVKKRLDAIGATAWPKHAGLIITVVNQDEADRDIPRLVALKGELGIPWIGLSCEPLQGPIDLRGAKLDWIIVGGESGTNARPMQQEWALGLRDQCEAADIPFLFKQWGEWLPEGDAYDRDLKCIEDGPPPNGMYRVGKKAAGRLLDGRTWDGFPAMAA